MQFDVEARTIYLTRHGSHAYGTNTPESDLDVKGVCIAPGIFYTGYLFAFEQEERMVSKGAALDSVIYSIKKFFSLAADCNPNIIEVMFSDTSDVLKCDKFGELLLENREEFISKRAKHTFSGYAHAQLKRINTHKKWLLEADKYDNHGPPTRESFGLPHLPDEKQKNQIKMSLAAVESRLDEWNVDMRGMSEADKIHLQSKLLEVLGSESLKSEEMWVRAAQYTFGPDGNLIERLMRERAYNNAVEDRAKYFAWKKSRNPKRAALEEKFGYDTKHAGHLIRLMRMCKEILTGKGVIVRRADAQEILEIRNGAWKYERIIEEAARLDEECNSLYETAELRRSPDVVKLNNLCSRITSEYIAKFG